MQGVEHLSVSLYKILNKIMIKIKTKMEGQPNLVHTCITFSQRIGKHTVSCLNGQCLSK